MSAPSASALVRCRDEEGRVGRLIDSLREQTLGERLELVVIDSGSRDGSLDEIRSRGIEPLTLAPERFSYGRALNLAAAAAGGEICIAISAHALPPDAGWAERMTAALADERVACASAELAGPDLASLSGPVLQDLDHALRHPFWGYANKAGAFRRALWRERPFDESLEASEDKEWALHWLRRGMLVAIDPALSVHHSHADEGPLRAYRRNRDCYRAHTRFQELEPARIGSLASEWWSGPHLHRSDARARLDPRRAALLAGKYAGLRRARERRR